MSAIAESSLKLSESKSGVGYGACPTIHQRWRCVDFASKNMEDVRQNPDLFFVLFCKTFLDSNIKDVLNLQGEAEKAIFNCFRNADTRTTFQVLYKLNTPEVLVEGTCARVVYATVEKIRQLFCLAMEQNQDSFTMLFQWRGNKRVSTEKDHGIDYELLDQVIVPSLTKVLKTHYKWDMHARSAFSLEVLPHYFSEGKPVMSLSVEKAPS